MNFVIIGKQSSQPVQLKALVIGIECKADNEGFKEILILRESM